MRRQGLAIFSKGRFPSPSWNRPFDLPRSYALCVSGAARLISCSRISVCACTRSHNTHRAPRPFAGGPGPIGPARGGKMGSAASPSRYSGRPEAGHDSRDARPLCPLSVKDHPFGVCACSLPGYNRLQSQAGRSLSSPSWSGPAFLLSAGGPGPIGPGLCGISGVRGNGVLGSSLPASNTKQHQR